VVHCVPPLKSGSLITANSALEQGREVFAIPSNIFSPGGAGVNKLIQDGAHPVTHINDILMSLNLYMVPQQVEVQADLPTSAEEQVLLTLLGQEPCHIDDLIRESKLLAQDATAALTTLELKGMIKQVGGMQYVRAICR
jgi:DNA processing protein